MSSFSAVDSFSSTKGLILGIIGGGQLGKMLALEAKRMSLKLAILDPDQHCPASTLADKLIVSDFKDENSIRKLARISDVLTYEIELTNSKVLEDLESKNYPVHPAPRTLNIIQNKLKQKQFLKAKGIPLADFVPVTSSNQIRSSCKEFGYPLLLKACEDSYDGRGNCLIHSEDDIERGLRYFLGRECMIERSVPFSKEISIMVARNTTGQIESFPVVENIHDRNILITTIAPARISAQLAKKARETAERAVRSLSGAGIFGVEMFLKKDGDILINEIAPRPHNSGHYSIEACSISQFEQHIRAILGLPLSKPRLISPAVMTNILGIDGYSGPYSFIGIRETLDIQGLKLHFYGKTVTKPQRKLGHMTITDESVEEALAKAGTARKALIVETDKHSNTIG
ncbi:MAG: 5-(carboxyamino)imidazole ribonucleotide synthase [Thermoproteota archaeon]|nr:5-(carboxyamino)imidazole ribonucleotide synthase [Thermoproteota archaeon]